MRDLCRARADLVADRRRARQRLGSLGRHAHVYRAGKAWTHAHAAWLGPNVRPAALTPRSTTTRSAGHR
ncbi:MAG: hypothetical protein ACRDYA_02050 [Egibacteraceae bacterium]